MREPWGLETLYRACVANPKTATYDDIRIVLDGQRKNVWRMPRYDFEIMIQKNQMHVGIMSPRAAWEDVGGYPETMREGREFGPSTLHLGGGAGVVSMWKGSLAIFTDGTTQTAHCATPVKIGGYFSGRS